MPGEALLDWYAAVRRPLPWRFTRDPWAILVSEVMLQQTQAARVVPRYERFLARFPTSAAGVGPLGARPPARCARDGRGAAAARRRAQRAGARRAGAGRPDRARRRPRAAAAMRRRGR